MLNVTAHSTMMLSGMKTMFKPTTNTDMVIEIWQSVSEGITHKGFFNTTSAYVSSCLNTICSAMHNLIP